MVTGVFVTLRARGAPRRVASGRALVFHPRSSNLHAADLVRAHAIARHVVVASVGRKKNRRKDERCSAFAEDLYDHRLSGRLLFYLVPMIAIRLDRFASARHVESVVAILLLLSFSLSAFFLPCDERARRSCSLKLGAAVRRFTVR